MTRIHKPRTKKRTRVESVYATGLTGDLDLSQCELLRQQTAAVAKMRAARQAPKLTTPYTGGGREMALLREVAYELLTSLNTLVRTLTRKRRKRKPVNARQRRKR